MQHHALRCVLFLGCQCAYVDGITAMSPDEYKDRFVYFMKHEVLHYDDSAQHHSDGKGPTLDAVKSTFRWKKLYENQRNGLVAQRLKDETADRQAAMEELEKVLKKNEELAKENNRLGGD